MYVHKNNCNLVKQGIILSYVHHGRINGLVFINQLILISLIPFGMLKKLNYHRTTVSEECDRPPDSQELQAKLNWALVVITIGYVSGTKQLPTNHSCLTEVTFKSCLSFSCELSDYSRADIGREYWRFSAGFHCVRAEITHVTLVYISLAGTTVWFNWKGKKEGQTVSEERRAESDMGEHQASLPKTMVDCTVYLVLPHTCWSTFSHGTLPSGTNENESLQPKRLPYIKTV